MAENWDELRAYCVGCRYQPVLAVYNHISCEPSGSFVQSPPGSFAGDGHKREHPSSEPATAHGDEWYFDDLHIHAWKYAAQGLLAKGKDCVRKATLFEVGCLSSVSLLPLLIYPFFSRASET